MSPVNFRCPPIAASRPRAGREVMALSRHQRAPKREPASPCTPFRPASIHSSRPYVKRLSSYYAIQKTTRRLFLSLGWEDQPSPVPGLLRISHYTSAIPPGIQIGKREERSMNSVAIESLGVRPGTVRWATSTRSRQSNQFGVLWTPNAHRCNEIVGSEPSMDAHIARLTGSSV